MIYNCSIWNIHCLFNKVLNFFCYSAVSSLSGMNHNSTAFVGCDQGKVINWNFNVLKARLYIVHTFTYFKSAHWWNIVLKSYQTFLCLANILCKNVYILLLNAITTWLKSCHFVFCSVVHVLVLKVEDRTTVVLNALQLTVVLSQRKLSFGFGFGTECPMYVCGRNVWN